ncbi:calcium-binding protein [Sinorhizobium medicae]
MSRMKFPAAAALAALMAIGTTSAAVAQAPAPVPPTGEMPATDQVIEPDIPTGDEEGTGGAALQEQPDRMREDMIRGDGKRGYRMHGDRMRHRDRMGGAMMHRQMMHRQMMKVMFAITDADNDGALSFEEISTIHKRIFDKVDINRDGKVTPDEIQGFFRN